MGDLPVNVLSCKIKNTFYMTRAGIGENTLSIMSSGNSSRINLITGAIWTEWFHWKTHWRHNIMCSIYFIVMLSENRLYKLLFLISCYLCSIMNRSHRQTNSHVHVWSRKNDEFPPHNILGQSSTCTCTWTMLTRRRARTSCSVVHLQDY